MVSFQRLFPSTLMVVPVLVVGLGGFEMLGGATLFPMGPGSSCSGSGEVFKYCPDSCRTKSGGSACSEPVSRGQLIMASAVMPAAEERDANNAEAIHGLVDEVTGMDDRDWMPSNPDLIDDKPMEVEVPFGLPPLRVGVNVPESNPITVGKYELGRQLYFDPRVSLNGTVSCATCHNPELGWADTQEIAIGINGSLGNRNSPTVINTVYNPSQFWDGRAESLEAQALGPVASPVEMGDQDHYQIVERLRTIPGYVEQFEKVFGTNVTVDAMAKAIATFERVAALSGAAPYDMYIAGESEALTDTQKRGLVLFGLNLDPFDDFETSVVKQKAKCSLCHVGFNFTDNKYHNLGIGYDPDTKTFADLGRFGAEPIGAKTSGSIGAFKTPTLREVARTAPYMHDGSEATLIEVVELYNEGGVANPHLDKDMQPLKLTEQEIADVVAFMEALTGETQKIELPVLPAGPDGNRPDPAQALMTPTRNVAQNRQSFAEFHMFSLTE